MVGFEESYLYNPIPTHGAQPPSINMLEGDDPGKEKDTKEEAKKEEASPALTDSPTPGWAYHPSGMQLFLPDTDGATDEFKDINMIVISDGEEDEENHHTYPVMEYDPEIEALIEQWEVEINIGDCNPINSGTHSGRAFKRANLGQTSNHAPLVEPENEIIKQLMETQTNISIWDMLMASQSHREAVQKALSSVEVPFGTSPNQLADIVGAVYTTNALIFTEKELPLEGRDHTRALYITVDFIGNRIRRVLVDNGSALNVCPLHTLTSIGLDPSSLKPSTKGMRAYDNTRREVIGILTAEIVVGPSKFQVDFQVIDILASFNLLLGRPWLHATGAVPSSLHQRLKYIENHHVVTIMADPNFVNALAVEGNIPELSSFSLEQVCAISIDPSRKETIFVSQIDTCNHSYHSDKAAQSVGGHLSA